MYKKNSEKMVYEEYHEFFLEKNATEIEKEYALIAYLRAKIKSNMNVMKRASYILGCAMALLSCKEEQSDEKVSSDNAWAVEENVAPRKDTTIVYRWEGIGNENDEATVYYSGGKIVRGEAMVYGATDKSDIRFEFEDEKIIISRKKYTHKKRAEHGKSDDIELISKIEYQTDHHGNYLDGDRAEDDFHEILKKQIPFELK